MKRKNEEFTEPNLFRKLLQILWSGLSRGIQGIGTLIKWILKLPFRLLYYLLNGRVPKFELVRKRLSGASSGVIGGGVY
jgi:hypothetical protein